MKTMWKVFKNEYKNTIVFPSLLFLMYFFFGFIPKLVKLCQNKYGVYISDQTVFVLSLVSAIFMFIIATYYLWFRQDKYKLSNVNEASVLISKMFILFLLTVFFSFMFLLFHFILKCIKWNLSDDMAITTLHYYDLFLRPIGLGLWIILMFSFSIALSPLGQSKMHVILKMVCVLIIFGAIYMFYLYINSIFSMRYEYFYLPNRYEYDFNYNDYLTPELYFWQNENLFFTVNFMSLPIVIIFLLTVTNNIFLYFIKKTNSYANLNCKTQSKAIITAFSVFIICFTILLCYFNFTPINLGEKEVKVNLETGQNYDVSVIHDYDDIKYNNNDIYVMEKIFDKEDNCYYYEFGMSNFNYTVDEETDQLTFKKPGNYIVEIRVCNIFNLRTLKPIKYYVSVTGDDLTEDEVK